MIDPARRTGDHAQAAAALASGAPAFLAAVKGAAERANAGEARWVGLGRSRSHVFPETDDLIQLGPALLSQLVRWEALFDSATEILLKG